MQTRNLNVAFSGGELAPEMLGRIDDARYRTGVRTLRNMIVRPQGSVRKRPGLRFVSAAKDSSHPVNLIPFRFSSNQTMALSFSRATVDGRSIGNIRFHTQGGNLLYTQPRDYVSPRSIIGVNVGTDEIDLGSAHGLQTSDPVIITLGPNQAVTFTSGSPGTVNRVAHGLGNAQPVQFSGSGLPTEVQAGVTYYVINSLANTFQIAKAIGLSAFTFGNGNGNVAGMPIILSSGHVYSPGETMFAIIVSATVIKVASTSARAAAGTAMDVTWPAIGDAKVHYRYESGDLAFVSGSGSSFYCMRRPWENHFGSTPPNTAHWYREPGTTSTVTFTVATDRVTWAAHGLTEGSFLSFSTTGTLPGLTPGTTYYVRNPTTNDFQVSLTPTGAIVDLAGGVGTHRALAGAFYEVPHPYTDAAIPELNYVQSGDIMSIAHQTRDLMELRRLGATRWTMTSAQMNSALLPPSTLTLVSAVRGEARQISQITAQNPCELAFLNDHGFVVDDAVYIFGMTGAGGTSIPEGYYLVKSLPTSKKITLKRFDTGTDFDCGGAGFPLVDTGSVQPSTGVGGQSFESYVVTAIDSLGLESSASAEISINNNLLAPGSKNVFSWSSVTGAVRYRVYKQANGLFGFVGQVETGLTFTDDGIAPDFALTSPRIDSVLRTTKTVTFDLSGDTVSWVAHGLPANRPIYFESDDTLPTGIEDGVTYYVVNPAMDTFQVSATPGGSAINLGGSPAGTHTAVTGSFAAAVAYVEQRRGLFGLSDDPQAFVISNSQSESSISFHLPLLNTDRISLRVPVREVALIRHAIPLGHLVLLTDSAEVRVTPVNDDFLTPDNVSTRPFTYVGSSYVRPWIVNGAALFVAARSGHLHELGLSTGALSIETGDLSVRAVHLFDGLSIVSSALQRSPITTWWGASSNGTGLGLVYIPEEQVGAWHRHDTGGDAFESFCCVSEGVEDAVYAVVRRSVNGQQLRYIERMDFQARVPKSQSFFVDSGASFPGPLPAGSILPVQHLVGRTVTMQIDGVKMPSVVVPASGLVTLPVACSTFVAIGIAYTSELQTLPLALQSDAAFGRGRTKNISRVWIRCIESSPFLVGPTTEKLVPSAASSASLTNGSVQVVVPGDWQYDGAIVVRHDDPFPLELVDMSMEISVGN